MATSTPAAPSTFVYYAVGSHPMRATYGLVKIGRAPFVGSRVRAVGGRLLATALDESGTLEEARGLRNELYGMASA